MAVSKNPAGSYYSFISRPGIWTDDEINTYANEYNLTSGMVEDITRERDRRNEAYSQLLREIGADTSNEYIANATPWYTDAERQKLYDHRDSLRTGIAGTNSPETVSAPKTYEEYIAEKTAYADNAQQTANTYLDNIYGNALGYLEKAKSSSLSAAGEYYNYAVGAAERDRANAIKAAETTRQREAVDASTSYSRALSTYGANAERLADMGLTGSGYSDYINSKAYATSRGEIQNAKAREQSAKQSAEDSYSKALADAKYQKLKAETEAGNAYMQGLYNADTARAQGRYEAQKARDEAVSGYMDALNLKKLEDAETEKAKKDAADKAATEAFNSLLLEIDAYTDDTDIESYAAAYSLTDEQKNELYRIRNEKKASDDRYSLGLGETSLGMVDRLYREGKATKDEVYSVYGNTISAALSAMTENDLEMVIAELQGYLRNDKISEAMYNTYLSQLGQAFGKNKVKKLTSAKAEVEKQSKAEVEKQSPSAYKDEMAAKIDTATEADMKSLVEKLREDYNSGVINYSVYSSCIAMMYRKFGSYMLN